VAPFPVFTPTLRQIDVLYSGISVIDRRIDILDIAEEMDRLKKSRIYVVLTAAALSALLLFGGWMLYNKTAIAAPLEKAIADLPDVVDYDKPIRSQDLVKVELQLTNNANVREIYHDINTNAASAIGDRKLELNIKSEQNSQLELIWQSALFPIAEAMESKAYSQIPAIMSDAAASYEQVSAVTEIDEDNVYITLKNEDSVKYIVLPRVPAQLEVWTNA